MLRDATKPIKCLISTGLGRLHLVQSAQYLAEAGVDVELVQGWVPRLLPDCVINQMGRFIGSEHLAAGMRKRRAAFLHPRKNHSCTLAEFSAQGLNIASRFELIGRETALVLGWVNFGRSSARFIKNHDIFHVRAGAGRGGAIKMAKSIGMKVVVDYASPHPVFWERTLRAEYARFNLPFSLTPTSRFWQNVIRDAEDSDLILVNSTFPKETLVQEGFAADKIAIAYLGVRSDFLALKAEYATRSQLKLLFTGSFSILKGAHYLVEALETLARNNPHFELTVVGSYEEAKTIVAASTAAPFINCTGFVPQDSLKEHLAMADIYVFPSLADGCASSGMEAMAAGLPVIATRESGLPIRHGENGWLISSKSKEAIVEAITLLASDRELRERLGRNATNSIAANFTWEHYAHNVLKIYEGLLCGEVNN